MLNFELTISALTLVGIVFAAAIIGFSFRSIQIKKKQFKIQELKKEIVYNHGVILELEKEYVMLESQMKAAKAPVLPMNMQVRDYIEETKKVADGFM